MTSKLRLIVLGAPGSGKGTISSRLVKEFRLSHLSSGDLLRLNIQKKTEIGLKAKDLVAQGKLLPDEFITKIVLQELQKFSTNQSWLLDGFPRTLTQAKALDSAKDLDIDRVINLNVPFEVIINRLKHRWVHPSSGRVYNTEFNPPKVSKKDDITGDPLVQRADDSESVVLNRLKIYESQIKPLIDFYSSKNQLVSFTGNTSDYLWPLIKQNISTYASSKITLTNNNYPSSTVETVTHTGEIYSPEDYRRGRFEITNEKLVNKNIAADLVARDPIVVCDASTVWSSGGGPLGHPKVYINLNPPEVQDCGYSGRRFIKKKYYDESKHGKAITYDAYLKDMEQKELNGF